MELDRQWYVLLWYYYAHKHNVLFPRRGEPLGQVRLSLHRYPRSPGAHCMVSPPGVTVCAYSAAMRCTATLPVDRFVPTDRVS